jgi:hypothetical protein
LKQNQNRNTWTMRDMGGKMMKRRRIHTHKKNKPLRLREGYICSGAPTFLGIFLSLIPFFFSSNSHIITDQSASPFYLSSSFTFFTLSP